MLNFQIATKEDLREAAKIEKKRQYEKERRERIFNPKNRAFGIDLKQLDRQIEEKKLEKYMEQERERKYLEEEARRSIIIQAKEKELEQDRQRRTDELNSYRQTYQRKEDRKEFDLNDPQQYKLPLRSSDADDERLGISSVQVFIGEDRMLENRRLQQNQQQKAWLEQQIRDQKLAELARINADKLLDQALEARGRLIGQLESTELENRKRMTEALAEYNKSLATERQKQKEIRKMNEHQDNLAEVFNTLNSDLLTGNPNVANSVFGPKKKIASLYRGMSPEDLEKIKREQLAQIEEKNAKKREYELEKLKWEEFNRNLQHNIQLKAAELAKLERARFEEVQKHNYSMSIEQKKRKELEKRSRSYTPSEEYYAQFNTTSR